MENRDGDVAAPAGQCPWLVYEHGKSCKKQTFCCNITGPSPVKTYCESIPALRDKKVVSCFCGWLVLYDDNTKLLSLCNSTTFDVPITLPRLHHLSDYKIDSCVLHVTNNSFKVVIFLKNFMSIMCWRVGSEVWSEIKYSKQLMEVIVNRSTLDRGPLFFSGAVMHGGIIFALLRADWIEYGYKFIWSLEIVEEEEKDDDAEEEEETLGLVLSQLPLPDRNLAIDGVDFYLLESCGELFLLYFISGTLVFEVYRFNFSSFEWGRVERVEETAFFVGESYCLSCPASGSGRIYFISKKDPSLLCYYLHDDSVLVSLPCPDLPTRPVPSPSWIMPRVLNGLEDNYIHEQGRTSTGSIVDNLDENIEEEQLQVFKLFDLPLDGLEQVSKHLKAMDYMNFRAVSRITRSVAPPVNWRRALSGTNYFCFPLLMFADRDENVYKFVDPSINNSNNYYQMRIPDSLEKQSVFHYSNHGWLLLSQEHHGVHLYNPFLGLIIGYTNTYGVEQSLFFLSNPFGAAYSPSLVCVHFLPKGEVSVSTVDDHGAEHWTQVVLRNDRSVEAAQLTSPVFFDDAFYYLDLKGNLGILKIDKLEEGFDLSWEVLDKPRHPPCVNDSMLHQNFLLECGGELVSVFIGHLGKWVAVYKLNDKQDWETVTNLGNYNLYLSRASSFSARTSCRGNRIYFPSLRGSEIIFFSLDTCKWHFSGSKDSSTDFYGTRLLLNSCWIKPSW